MMLVLIAVIVGLISAFILYFRWYHSYWARHGIDGPSFFENLSMFKEPTHLNRQKYYQKYGTVFGTYDLFRKSIVINDPEIIKEIMVKHFDKFVDRKNVFVSLPLGYNIFNASSALGWKRMRTIITPTFTTSKLKEMMEPINAIADRLVEELEVFTDKNESIDIKMYTSAFAMDVLTSCAYGIKTDSLKDPNNELLRKAKRFFGIDLKLTGIICVIFPSLARLLNLQITPPDVTGYFAELTKRIVEERKKQHNSKQRKDFLQLMINANEESNNDPQKSLSMDELIGQGILFFIAGHDTTSNTLGYCINYLSQDQQVQNRLFQEISALEQITTDTLANCDYLNAVINESLRLMPPLNLMERACLVDHTLSNGIYIPKNTNITFLPYSIHRDPKHFPDPDKFDPTRFLDGGSSHHPYAYIPFGGGPRLCLGMRFAMNEMRMFLAKTLIKYRFEKCTDKPLEFFVGNLLLVPKSVPVKISKRN